ncbi:MAG: phosphotransferase [Pseudomonadota bacterium]
MLANPTTIEEITPAWMTMALGQGVRALETENLGGEGRGFLSGVARVRLDYAAPVDGAPESVVVKLPTTVEAGREIALANKAYLRELRFYREIAPESPIRVPRCYFACLDDSVLVLEDARAWTPGDQIAGLSLAQAEAAVRAIGRFHAHWWDRTGAETLDWVPKEVSLSFRLYEESWPGFLERHASEMSPDAQAVGARVAANCARLSALIAAGRQTLVHGDFRADNLLFQGPGVLALDWQWLTRMIGAYDVARLVCGSLPTRLGHGNHRRLCGLWHQELTAAGVAGYGPDAAWRDYQLGLLLYSYLPVVCDYFFSHEGGRSRQLLHALIDRVFHAVTECGAVERLG